MYNVGRTFVFDAAHFIEGHPTCGQLHGHTWKLEVELLDCELQPNGMVIDFKVFGGIVKDVIIKLDHKVINEVIEDHVPIVTAETLAKYFCYKIFDRLRLIAPETEYKMICCRLQEGEGGYAVYLLEV